MHCLYGGYNLHRFSDALGLVNYWSVFCHICIKVLYFNELFLLSAILWQIGNTIECPFCGLIEAFVLDQCECFSVELNFVTHVSIKMAHFTTDCFAKYKGQSVYVYILGNSELH